MAKVISGSITQRVHDMPGITAQSVTLQATQDFVRDVLENCFHQKTTKAQVASVAKQLIKIAPFTTPAAKARGKHAARGR